MAKIPSDLSPDDFLAPPAGAADLAAAFACIFFSILVITVAIIAWFEAGFEAPVSY